jgi:putative transposase
VGGIDGTQAAPCRLDDFEPHRDPGGPSQIVRRYHRVSRTTQRTLLRVYVEGLSSGDFEPVFRTILGETAPLSASRVGRFKEQWQAEYRAWAQRPVADPRDLDVWVDGVSLDAGQEDEQTARLVVLGLRADGKKELLGLGLGYRERSASWATVLRDLRDRGMERPVLVIGDGARGIGAAVREVWPQVRRQRCWNHKICNVLDQLPKRLWARVRTDLRQAIASPTRAACGQRLEEIAAALRRADQDQATETLLRDLDDVLTFYDFPKEHRVHLRTTHQIESIFAGVRVRTDVAKRLPNRENARYLVFKVIERLGQNWMGITAGSLCRLVLEGRQFVDGVLAETVAAYARRWAGGASRNFHNI